MTRAVPCRSLLVLPGLHAAVPQQLAHLHGIIPNTGMEGAAVLEVTHIRFYSRLSAVQLLQLP